MSFFDKLFKKQPKQTSAQDNASFSPESHVRKVEDSAAEVVDAISLLDLHEEGGLDDVMFLAAFGNVKVFYSTPFGDHKDGGSRLFLLPAKDKTAYLPVFSSNERAVEFYEKAGRQGYLIMEASFVSFLETTRKMNAGNTPIKLGAVIDPGYYGVTVDVGILDSAIAMIKEHLK